MRYTLAAAVLALWCASCQPNQQAKVETALPEAAVTPDTLPPTLHHDITAIIKGVWVRATYLDALSDTHSPQQVADANLANDLTAFAIDLGGKNDSLTLNYIWNNHEGGLYTVLKNPDYQQQTLPILPEVDEGTRMELAYVLLKNDTLLKINSYNQHNKLLESDSYRRVRFQPDRNSQVHMLRQGLEWAVNTALVAGKYCGTDSTAKALEVAFKPNGKVSGLRNVQDYAINIDFNNGPETGEDMLFLNVNSYNHRQDVGYRIKQDTLKVYTLRSDSIGLPVLHRPLYTLVRRR